MPHYSHAKIPSLTGRLLALFRGKIAPWMFISDYSFERLKNNRTLVNSDWTGRVVKQVYGIDALTLHPPVPGTFPDVPWEQRENGFVCIGRLAKSGKRLDWIIAMLGQVCRRFPDLQLHIVGVRELHRASGRQCWRQLEPLLRADAEWVRLHHGVYAQRAGRVGESPALRHSREG